MRFTTKLNSHRPGHLAALRLRTQGDSFIVTQTNHLEKESERCL